MTGFDAFAHAPKTMDSYFRGCTLIDPRSFLKTYCDHAIIFIEPHPDDTVLNAGGLLFILNQAFSSLSIEQRLYNITAVSGHHSVDNSFIENVDANVARRIMEQYRSTFKMFSELCQSVDDEGSITEVKEYYDECLQNIASLEGVDYGSKRVQSMLKGGLRSFIENKHALDTVISSTRLECYNALLPFYDSCAGITPAVQHPINVFVIKNLVRTIIKRSAKKDIVVFIDNSHDPHGTHERVRSIVNKALLALVEQNEIKSIVYYMMHGSWRGINVSAAEQAQAVFFEDDVIEKKCEAFDCCQSQIEAVVSGDDSTRFDVRVKERNALYANELKKYHQGIKGDYAEFFFYNDFMGKEGKFNKEIFVHYIRQREGDSQ